MYLITDYHQKGSLRDLLDIKNSKTHHQNVQALREGRYQDIKSKGLDHRLVRFYMIDMLKALHYCHNVVKLIHKDIKPDNIVINKQHQAILIDFGVSALFNDENNVSSSCMGSYLYQAPEIFKNQDFSDNHIQKG